MMSISDNHRVEFEGEFRRWLGHPLILQGQMLLEPTGQGESSGLDHGPVDSAHDGQHSRRVLWNALDIRQTEGGDPLVLALAACLHDWGALPKNHPDRAESSKRSAERVMCWVKGRGLSVQQEESLYDAILNHSYSRGQVPVTLEGRVFQDADRMDALGALGIARLFAVGGSFGAQLYCPQDPFLKGQRVPDDRRYSTDHVFTKLAKIPDMMLTRGGRELAKRRWSFILHFVQQMEMEIPPCG